MVIGGVARMIFLRASAGLVRGKRYRMIAFRLQSMKAKYDKDKSQAVFR